MQLLRDKKNEFLKSLKLETRRIVESKIKKLEEEGTFRIEWYGDRVCLSSACFKGCISADEALLISYITDFVTSGGWVSNAERCKVGSRYMEVSDFFVELWPKVRFHKGSLLEGLAKLRETYVFGNYDFALGINPKNKVIVDIGAWVGEFSLRASRRGAKKVYSLEPNPYAYQWLQENADLSEVYIDTLNALIGKKGEERFLLTPFQEEMGRKGGTVKSIPLEDLMDFWGIKEGDLIRISCCLKNILKGDLTPLKNFKYIVIDYSGELIWDTLVPALRKWKYSITFFKPYPYLAPPLEKRGVLVASSL
ncbi:hypothetical protein IPA_03945 [Ignicoccus pacificus DSM 13166]|uniref:TRM5/TYW2-like methyltransferase domain-containing protein n=1 Tax=Ignicoccus pacificus DSM 13166 TaxID=940294 RepID=A0A977PKV2_9CREN|nr:hypothetical protein IPA_03945 [Ignicoccus pacificus DSM 13166]